MKISKRKVNDWLLSQGGTLDFMWRGWSNNFNGGVIALTRTVSGENKFILGIWRFCRESGNLGNFSGNMRYFRDIEQRFDITCYQTIYIQWYAPSVCAVFYVFWHLKMAELPMIWKDQSAMFPTKIAWSWSAILTTCNPQQIDTRTVLVHATYFQYT